MPANRVVLISSSTGTAVYLIGTMSANGGRVSIQLDDEPTAFFDRYAATSFCGIDIFSKDGLTNGPHTLAVVLDGYPTEPNRSVLAEIQYITCVGCL